MAAHTSLYRTLVQLYPQQFRRYYGDDLMLHFEDMVRRDGLARAWCRTAIDLLVTVPRYRMENIMNPRNSNTGVIVLVALLALAGPHGYFAGFPPALLLLVIALGVAVAERGRLASSLRASTPARRRHLAATSGLLILASLATLFVGFADLGDDDWPANRVLFYNAVFFALLITAVVCGVKALRAPHSSQNSNVGDSGALPRSVL